MLLEEGEGDSRSAAIGRASRKGLSGKISEQRPECGEAVSAGNLLEDRSMLAMVSQQKGGCWDQEWEQEHLRPER